MVMAFFCTFKAPLGYPALRRAFPPLRLSCGLGHEDRRVSRTALVAAKARLKFSRKAGVAFRFRKCSQVFAHKDHKGVSQCHEDVMERPQFDINLAVLLAGFAFESYNTPAQEDTVFQEKDASNCETMYLCPHYLEEVYEGQLEVTVQRASGSNEPVWNETLLLPAAQTGSSSLQVAVWDANIVLARRRMGVAAVRYKAFAELAQQKKQQEQGGDEGGEGEDQGGWKLPWPPQWPLQQQQQQQQQQGGGAVSSTQLVGSALLPHAGEAVRGAEEKGAPDREWLQQASALSRQALERAGWLPPPEAGCAAAGGGWAIPEWLASVGASKRRQAEALYAVNSLAVPAAPPPATAEEEAPESSSSSRGGGTASSMSASAAELTRALFAQTEGLLSSWGVLGAASAFSLHQQEQEQEQEGEQEQQQGQGQQPQHTAEQEQEKTRRMFLDAESAVEAWALLSSSLNQHSFVKSNFSKICFLDHPHADTQVAVWRDAAQKRLVVAFRGTEQTKLKDLQTDLSLVPAELNPERTGGMFSDDMTVHGGFLKAYDAVRSRLVHTVHSIVMSEGQGSDKDRWRVYITGHSLGGALATLLAYDLRTSRLTRGAAFDVSMYNFGSPRVGNKRFAEAYNSLIKDSWRVVNRRDIIPTVPRLIGYCHVCCPIFLSAGGTTVAEGCVEGEVLDDEEHEENLLDELTPDHIFAQFMAGERQVLQRLIQTEIALLAAIRDGSALMMHMEDFYYIALLKRVEKNLASSTQQLRLKEISSVVNK
eukprot:jgi/Mesen1/4915/ME000246S04141